MKHNHYMIRRETPDDYQEVEYLTREAFWNVYRPGCIEHYIVHQYRCREDFVPELDFVMEKDDVIIGHIMYVNAEILSDNGQKIPIMTFGPISIAPEHQRKGYGKILLDFSMDKARALGVGAICIEGNIAFYGKSGFVTASSRNTLLCRTQKCSSSLFSGKRITRGIFRWCYRNLQTTIRIFYKRRGSRKI